MNGRSSKAYGHDITSLYADVCGVAGALIPARATAPPSMAPGPWCEISTEFVEHLWQNGNADNRYLIYGYASGTHDVFRLDSLVFAVRRLACPLDDDAVTIDGSSVGRTYRQLLEANPSWHLPMAMPLDEMIRGKGTPDAVRAALGRNFSFVPDAEHASFGRRVVARNPVLIRRILDPLASNVKNHAMEAVELASWLLANIQLPKGKGNVPGVREEISAAMAAAKARHGLP